jgi:hypothetical protein
MAKKNNTVEVDDALTEPQPEEEKNIPIELNMADLKPYFKILEVWSIGTIMVKDNKLSLIGMDASHISMLILDFEALNKPTNWEGKLEKYATNEKSKCPLEE